jgi:hypothetical protein
LLLLKIMDTCADAGPLRFANKPDIPFKLLGFTDLKESDFVYFKTAGGNWLAAAEDETGRLFMIDQVNKEGLGLHFALPLQCPLCSSTVFALF